MKKEKIRTEQYPYRAKKFNMTDFLFRDNNFGKLSWIQLSLLLFCALSVFFSFFSLQSEMSNSDKLLFEAQSHYYFISLLFFAILGIFSFRLLSSGVAAAFSASPNKYSPIAAGYFFSILYSAYMAFKSLSGYGVFNYFPMVISSISLIAAMFDAKIYKKTAGMFFLRDNSSDEGAKPKAYDIISDANSDVISTRFSGFFCPEALAVSCAAFAASLLCEKNIELGVANALFSASLSSVYFISFGGLSTFRALKKASLKGIYYKSSSTFIKSENLADCVKVFPTQVGCKEAVEFECNGISISLGNNILPNECDIVFPSGKMIAYSSEISKNAIRRMKYHCGICAVFYPVLVGILLFTI